MIVDAHQHFWNLVREPMAWMTAEHAVIRRTFGPADLAPLLVASGRHADGARAGGVQRLRHGLDVRARGAA